MQAELALRLGDIKASEAVADLRRLDSALSEVEAAQKLRGRAARADELELQAGSPSAHTRTH